MCRLSSCQPTSPRNHQPTTTFTQAPTQLIWHLSPCSLGQLLFQFAIQPHDGTSKELEVTSRQQALLYCLHSSCLTTCVHTCTTHTHTAKQTAQGVAAYSKPQHSKLDVCALNWKSVLVQNHNRNLRDKQRITGLSSTTLTHPSKDPCVPVLTNERHASYAYTPPPLVLLTRHHLHSPLQVVTMQQVKHICR